MEEETKGTEGLTEADVGAQGPAPVPEKPLDQMTALELREFAKGLPGIEGVTAMKKEQLLEIVKERLGIKDDKPPEGAAAGGSVQELKGRIAGLKVRKREALETGRGKDADILRRRINRLKKMTRKVPRG